MGDMTCPKCGAMMIPGKFGDKLHMVCTDCFYMGDAYDNADLLDIARGRKRAPAPTPAPQPERTSGTAALLREAARLLGELSEAAEIMRELTDDCDILRAADDGYSLDCTFCYCTIKRFTRGDIQEYSHADDCPVPRARDWLARVGLDGER